MFLLEHDGKTLLAGCGVPVPEGVLATGRDAISWPGPVPGAGWVAKAQVKAGGRGKAGGIRPFAAWEQVADTAAGILGMSISGHVVRSVRIEACVPQAAEAYVSLSLAPAEGKIRVMASEQGGVEVEAAHGGGAVLSALAEPAPGAVAVALARLSEGFAPAVRAALHDAAPKLAAAFFDRDLSLLEINPLFVLADGSWMAGDAKIVIDENAAWRQDFLRTLLAERAEDYPEPALKLATGFDYVVLDPQGEVGLLTTGAGLSMMLVDELHQNGLRPYNFVDVRTGGLKDDPSRLVEVFGLIARGGNVRVVLCNVFGGATDLGAFAQLLLKALERRARPDLPLVLRIAGNAEAEAHAVLEAQGLSVHSDLGQAIAATGAYLK